MLRNLPLSHFRSAQSQRTIVSTTLSASSSMSRIPIQRNSSLRRKKEVMDSYNSPKKEVNPDYSYYNNDYNQSMVNRQSVSNASVKQFSTKDLPKTPTDNRINSSFEHYSTPMDNIRSFDDRNSHLIQQPHDEVLSVLTASPGKTRKTVLTR